MVWVGTSVLAKAWKGGRMINRKKMIIEYSTPFSLAFVLGFIMLSKRCHFRFLLKNNGIVLH